MKKKGLFLITILFFSISLINMSSIIIGENNDTNSTNETNSTDTNTTNICEKDDDCQQGYECENKICELDDGQDDNGKNETNDNDEDDDKDEEDCEKWECEKWSECVDNVKTRTCIENTECNETDDEIPKQEKPCKEKKRIKTHYKNDSECPDNCSCSGSTIKCDILGGREMTITAGKSGNIIIQVKGINMSTNVTLYKEKEKIYGIFKGNKTQEVKILPDEVKKKIKQRIKAKLEDEEITLDEDGKYQTNMKKRARFFGIFPVREKVKIELDSETGEIIKIKTSWWGFLARDIKEDIEE